MILAEPVSAADISCFTGAGECTARGQHHGGAQGSPGIAGHKSSVVICNRIWQPQFKARQPVP